MIRTASLAFPLALAAALALPTAPRAQTPGAQLGAGRSLAGSPPQKVVLPVAPPTVIPINALPFVAAAPGYYQVTQNLTGMAGDNGISILADDVVVDLNGFAVLGAPGSLTGIRTGFRSIVFNGQVGTWGQAGISTGSESVVANVTALVNGAGIDVGLRSRVEACTARENLGAGIAGPALTVVGCRAVGNKSDGIRGEGDYLRVWGCEALFNEGYGIRAEPPGGPGQRNDAVVEDCIVQGNGLGGIELPGCARVRGCTVGGHASTAILVGDSSSISDSILSGNGTGAVTGKGCSIRSCEVRDCGVGLSVGDESSVSDCEVADCPTGIFTGRGTSVQRCNVTRASLGITSTTGGRIEGCTVTACTISGVGVGARVLVSGNDVTDNPGCGILAVGEGCRIDGNHVAGNGTGIEVQGERCLVVRNSLDTNGVQTLIAPNNVVGPLLKTKGFIQNENPWANFDLSFPPQVP